MIRKIVHNNLNIRAARSYVPYQDLENKVMLKEMLENPDLFIDNIRRYSNSLSTQMLFGFRTIGIDDPKLKKLYHVRVCLDNAVIANSSIRVLRSSLS